MQAIKILMSAYACEPGKGSEPGVGWRWAIETAALNHEVWVITRTNNKAAITAGVAQHGKPKNLHLSIMTCQLGLAGGNVVAAAFIFIIYYGN
jgi:hypothetical protein